MTATSIEPVDPFAELDAAFAVYCGALAIDPGDPAALRWCDETLPRHASRDDFVFLAARERDAIVGIAYGYTGRYGQWWTDRVAAAMNDPTRREWLDPPHYEVVELHVAPEHQRRGIGSRLLDELLQRQPHDRAVLSTGPQALPFYEKHGWRRLAELRFAPDGPLRLVLGKRVGQRR